MPSKTDTQKGSAKRVEPDDLDNYFLEEDFEDDPFGSPNANADKNKRKEPEGLGIDEEVSVQKRARVPRVKLDETRLLSEKGIPKLRKKAAGLKLKGKGHEFSDTARLLSFYQLWLDDLFPKAKFLDALAMVEKAGHKKTMHKVRMDWINEGKPTGGDDTTQETQPSTTEGANTTSVAKPGQSGSHTTPAPEDLFGDEDIYNATPQQSGTKSAAPGHRADGGEPDEDDLDALMAEAEVNGQSGPARPEPSSSRAPTSIFGPARPKGVPFKPAPPQDEEDDLDALMAEAEASESTSSKPRTAEKGNVVGAGKQQAGPSAAADDDLDALMAEEAVQSNPTNAKPVSAPKESFADEEEAMAEMDGLW